MSGLGSTAMSRSSEVSPGIMGNSTNRLRVAGQQAEDDQPLGEARFERDSARAIGHAQLVRQPLGNGPRGQGVPSSRGVAGPGEEP